MTYDQQLIRLAQNHLRRQPFDIAHDFEHHQLVFQNAQQIIKYEQLSPDMKVLSVACWWHDINKSYDAAKSFDPTLAFFQDTAQKTDAPAAFIERCSQMIAEHSFGESQTSLESKILFDADKIEYVNAARIKKFVDAIAADPKAYDMELIRLMHRIWLKRLRVVKR